MTPAELTPIARALLRAHRTRAVTPTDLADALAVGRTFTLSEGEVLCKEGSPSEALYVLLSGEIQVLRRDPSGELRELAVLAAPALVGHMGLVDGSPRSATCVAVGSVQTLRLSRVDFDELLKQTTAASAALRHLLLSSLIHQLSAANEKVRELAAASTASAEEDVSSDDILKLAGVLEGWKVDTKELDRNKIRYTEDEDMRRTREARRRR